MATMTYGEQLKHPNWQRKRLEVLNRANFHCERCGDGDTTLHVHHKHYVKGRMAWEYEAPELTALCEPCHEAMHEERVLHNRLLAMLDADGPASSSSATALVAGWAGPYLDEAQMATWEYADLYTACLGTTARALHDANATVGDLTNLCYCASEPDFLPRLRAFMRGFDDTPAHA